MYNNLRTIIDCISSVQNNVHFPIILVVHFYTNMYSYMYIIITLFLSFPHQFWAQWRGQCNRHHCIYHLGTIQCKDIQSHNGKYLQYQSMLELLRLCHAAQMCTSISN